MSRKTLLFTLGLVVVSGVATGVGPVLYSRWSNERFIDRARGLPRLATEQEVIALLGEPYRPSGCVRLISMDQRCLPLPLRCPSEDSRELRYYLEGRLTGRWVLYVRLCRVSDQAEYVLWGAHVLRGNTVPDDLEVLVSRSREGT